MVNHPSDSIFNRYSNALFLGKLIENSPKSSVVVSPAVSKKPFNIPFSRTCSSRVTSKPTHGNVVDFSTTTPLIRYVLAQSVLQQLEIMKLAINK